MAGEWLRAMDKAIGLVDTQSTKLEKMAIRYSDLLDAALDRLSRVKMEPVVPPQAPNAPNIGPPPRIDQDGPDDFPEGESLAIDSPGDIDISSLLDGLDMSGLVLPEPPPLVTVTIPTAPVMN